MTCVTAIGAVLLLSTSALGATLTWNANSESDLAGYRVYKCSVSPCSISSGTANLLATLGKVTSFNVGTPSVTQYYLVTAYDFQNNESNQSNIVTYTPNGTSSTSAATVSLSVLGLPDRGEPWAVQATTDASEPLSVEFWVNGSLERTENVGPYCLFADNGTSCTRVLRPSGFYTVEARVLRNGVEVAPGAIILDAK